MSSPLNTIDDKQRGLGSGTRAVNRGVADKKTEMADAGAPRAEQYSETGKMLPAKPAQQQKKNSIAIDERNVAIGRARYEGATHITKNLAINPHYGDSGADLMNHTNIEVHLYDDKGHEQPMTRRWFRDWAYYPADPKKRIATLKSGDALNLVPGSTKRFLWESGSVFDAPGQQNIRQDDRTYVYVQEFVAGTPKTGGYYYQVVIMLDPNATSRVVVKNTVALTPKNYQDLLNVMADPNFEKDYANRYLIDNLPNTIQSDTGIDRTIPNLVQQKKQNKGK